MKTENVMKNKVLSGLVWKFGERITAQLVTFVVSLVLARILEPSDYGTIAIVGIFISIANVFLDSGFGNSLIQKKEADNVDFSSVFYFNMVMSVVLYIALFLCAPLIANFYDMPIICPVLRVLGIRLIVAGINSMQHAYVAKQMIFKRFFWATLGGTLLSAVAGIIMAYCGFGIWALVAQYMINTTVDTVVLWFTVKWRPTLEFSLVRLKSLFSFGWKLLVSSLINTVYSKMRGFIIGKAYSPSDLAYYSKGEHFPVLVVENINTSIQSVLFPAIAETQDKKQAVKAMVRRAIKTSSYIMFPLMIGLAIVAEPLIKFLLTDKWLPSVVYLQIGCAIYALIPIHTANLQAINAMGRSDIFLKLEIVKKIIGVTVFLVAVQFGVVHVAASGILTSLLTSFINAFPNKKLLDYGYFEQIKDLFPAVVLSVIMAIVVSAVSIVGMGDLSQLICQVLVGMVVYILSSWLFKNESFCYLLNTLEEIKVKIITNRRK